MNQSEQFLYSPVTRLKEGEWNAVSKLSEPVRKHIAPRFVLPSPKERDSQLKRSLTSDEAAYFSGERIGKFWPKRMCFVEPRYLIKEFGYQEIDSWLPRLFKIAADHHAAAVPLVSLDEIKSESVKALKNSVPTQLATKMGIRVRFADISENLKDRVTQALKMLGLEGQQCVVFLDFADADLSEPDIVADILSGALQTLQEVAVWSRIVFQGTNYPEVNPGIPGDITTVDRNEWNIWSKLVLNDKNAMDHLIYGDYGADSAKFEFSGGGAKPIPHMRYCGNDNKWHVARGKSEDSQGTAMKDVAGMILKSGVFSGRNFSDSDEKIYQIAHGISSSGTAKTWREINTGHHITQVVIDIAKIYGLTIEINEVEHAVQQELFHMNA